MTSEQATDLFNLRCTWDRYYLVNFAGDVWRASRLGTAATFTITADTARELRGLIWSDYSESNREAEKRS
jgi:hypothetical protein